MKKLAISMQVTEASNYFELRNSLAFNYHDFFEQLGFMLILIPNNTSILKKYFTNLSIDGIVLSGGNNVNPALYGGPNELSNVYPQRDGMEDGLIDIAVKEKIPLLGICRGFQFINVYFGGSISHGIKNHVKKQHKLISINPLLNLKTTNSYHNQGILKEDLSSQIKALAVTEDNIVEAGHHKSNKILGVQWHPERQNMEEDKSLILNLFNS